MSKNKQTFCALKTKIDKVIVNTPACLVAKVKTSNKHSNQAVDKIEKII